MRILGRNRRVTFASRAGSTGEFLDSLLAAYVKASVQEPDAISRQRATSAIAHDLTPQHTWAAYRGTILSSSLQPTACAYLRNVANVGA